MTGALWKPRMEAVAKTRHCYDGECETCDQECPAFKHPGWLCYDGARAWLDTLKEGEG